MAGVKGRSGRKAHLENKTIQEICRLSSATIFHALRSKELPLSFRAELASKFVLRAMPQHVEIDQSETRRLEILLTMEKMTDDELRAIINSRGRIAENLISAEPA